MVQFMLKNPSNETLEAGFVAIAPADQAQAIIDRLSTHDISAWVIGEIIPNAGEPLVFA